MKIIPSLFLPAGKHAKLSVVIYHRVLSEPDPLLGGEDISNFEMQLNYLVRNFNVLPLSDAITRLRRGTLPSCAVSITFDDGYADNVEIALPILQKYAITATFFIASGFVDGGRMWNDTVIESVRRARGDVLDLSEIGLGVYPISSLTDRRQSLYQVIDMLKYLPDELRQSQVEKIRTLIAADLPDNLMMTSSQVKQLYDAGMEIGGHTVNHPILTRITDADALKEIADGKETLEGIINAPVQLFAYPNGKPNRDYHANHVNMVKKVGFQAAVTTAWGAARSHDDLFQIPRFTPWDKNELLYTLRMVRNTFNTIEKV